MEKTALIIEDDPSIRALIEENLFEVGLSVEAAVNGREGLEKALGGQYAIIILDLMLPELGGMEICRQIRLEDPDTPILMLTAKDREVDRVLGLELGADDYLAKPFSISEFIARIKSLLRRSRRTQELLNENRSTARPASQKDVHEFPNLTIDTAKRKVILEGNPIELSANEFNLLVYLASAPGNVFTRAEILEAVWNVQNPEYEVNVNTCVNRLRHKLEKNPSKPVYVKTVRGIGYYFAEQS